MVKHMPLGGDLGLTLEGYIDIGVKEAMKGVCILCGDEPTKAGVCIPDGSEESRRAMRSPAGKFNHRFAFYALCESCQYDEDVDEKVKSKILRAVRNFK